MSTRFLSGIGVESNSKTFSARFHPDLSLNGFRVSPHQILKNQSYPERIDLHLHFLFSIRNTLQMDGPRLKLFFGQDLMFLLLNSAYTLL